MAEVAPIRRRIVPGVPYTLRWEDEAGKVEKSFKLAYDVDAFTLFEEVTGLNALSDMALVWDSPSNGVTSALLWAALQRNHNDSEYGGTAGLRALRQDLSVADMKAAFAACIEAFITQLPPEKAAEIRKRQKDIAEGKPVSPLAEGPATTA